MIWWFVYVAAGGVVGLLAGLLGIGGGMTLVPVLAALFTQQHFAPNHIVHMALATSMASIVFTSGSSVREHWKLGGIDLSVFYRIAPGMVVGSLLATLTSAWISQRMLALIFGLIVYLGATQILLNRKPSAVGTLPSAVPLTSIAVLIGVVCGLVSAGGAFLTVPLMLWCGVPLRTTVGTAALIGIPVAIVGTIGYLISGWTIQNLSDYSIGFISLPALSGIICGSVFTAPYGARLAHRLPTLIIKRIFACLLYALATKMLLSYV